MRAVSTLVRGLKTSFGLSDDDAKFCIQMVVSWYKGNHKQKPPGKGRPPKLSPKKQKEVKRLHRVGVSIRTLAVRFKVSKSTIAFVVAPRETQEKQRQRLRENYYERTERELFNTLAGQTSRAQRRAVS